MLWQNKSGHNNSGRSRSLMQPVSFRRSLSARLLWLTIGLVLLAEILVFVPSLGRERREWLKEHLRDAGIVASAATAVPGPQSERELLMRLSGADAVQIVDHGMVLVALGTPSADKRLARIDLSRESAVHGMWCALKRVVWDQETLIDLIGPSSLWPGAVTEVIFRDTALNRQLRGFARDIALTSLATAAATGALVYGALLVLLVRPMRRIIRSISAFRANPERGAPLDPEAVSVLANDEMAVAGRELSAMQQELRAALWRNARLAALGTAVAKFGHDLRNILTPATLAAERLAGSPDPKVARSGQVLIRAVDQATELLQQTLAFAREGPPALERTSFGLRDLVQEVADAVVGAKANFSARNDVAPDLAVEADRAQLFRVLLNLLRNAAEARAQQARVGASADAGLISIRIQDDGPGLPEQVRGDLFRPFGVSTRRGGSGLGLAIARDLMRAHGGDIVLVATDARGTQFRLDLPLAPLGRPESASGHLPEGESPAEGC